MTQIYTVAVIGAGSGGKLSMKAAAASDRFQLVAVADWREAACQEAEALYPGIRTFATHQELFAAIPVDVVCVSTWPPTHLSVTQDALALPLRGILVEKPLADQIDKQTPDYTWPAASLAALELCEAAYLSNQQRCMVSFPLATFTPPAPTRWEPGKPYAGQGGGRDGRRLTA